MSNFFDDALNDAKGLEEKILGPDYPYWKYIATPAQLGMSAEGGLSATATDVAGLINYVQMLVEGTGPANTGGGKPLGDKFFLKTGGQCKDTATGKLVDRYLYIDNVPDGSIPFLTAASGIKFTEFEGLIPGIMEDLAALNPITLFRGFMEGNNPPCTEVTLPTRSSTNVMGSETHHVTTTDLKSAGQEGLQNYFDAGETYNNVYVFICGIVLLYIVQRLLRKD